MRHTTRLSLCRFVGLLFASLLAAAPVRASDVTAADLCVSNTITQNSPAGTNVFIGPVGLNCEPDARLSLGGWTAGQDLLAAYMAGTNEFALQVHGPSGSRRILIRVGDQPVLVLGPGGTAGIGLPTNAAPAATLEVQGGAVRLSDSQRLILSDSAVGEENWSVYADGENLSIREKEHDHEAIRIEDVRTGFNVILKGKATTATNWLVVQSKGTVSLGTASPQDVTEKFYVAGDGRIDGTLAPPSMPDLGDLSMGSYTNQ